MPRSITPNYFIPARRVLRRDEDAKNQAVEGAKEQAINPYDVEIDTDKFLASFRIFEDAGYYASLRYIRDFLKSRLFEEASTELTEDKLPKWFRLGRKFASGKPKGVQLPEDKPYTKPKPNPKKSKKED